MYLGLGLDAVLDMTPVQLNMLKFAWSKRQAAAAKALERHNRE